MRDTSGLDATSRLHSTPCPPRRSAENLAFVNWTVLTGLALGSYAAVVLLARRTTATPGYLRFTAICALAFGALAWISDGALPTTLGDSPVVVDPAWDAPRRAAPCPVRRARRGRPRGRRTSRAASPGRRPLGAVAAAAATLVFGALAWGDGSLGALPARPAGGRQRGDRRRVRGDDPRPLVPRDAEAARGAAHPAGPRPARRRRRPGRPVLGVDRRPAPARPTSPRSRR